jgi:4-amino-4-deoxy-L-arabinose transferase-like glycosyltransferase
LRNLAAIWAIVAAAALAVHIGSYPLFEPDEGRNGEVAREMAATNDYVLPHIDGLPYINKPIVYFAAAAAVMEVTGPTATAARLPAWLFTLMTATVLAWFASKNNINGAWAAIIFLASPLTIAFARTVIFDSALTLFITISICCFYFAIEDDGRRSPLAGRRYAAAAWFAIGLGVITKGPVAIALPLMVAVPYAIWRKRARALWSPLGLVLFLAAIVPWVWAMQQRVPDFLQYVLVTETAQRLATKALKRTGPPWYFIPFLIGGAFPWAVAAFFGDRRPATGDRNRERFILLWIAIPFIFFSLSQSKRPQYILPLVAPIALWVARKWNDRMARAAAISIGTLGVLLIAAGPRLKLRPEYAASARDAALVIGVCAIVAAVVAFVMRRRALIVLTIPILIIPLATKSVMDSLSQRRSAQGVAEAVMPYLTPDTEVIGMRAFSASMQFYLQRPVIVVSPDGEEFTSNYLSRHYKQFADAKDSPLRSPAAIARVFDRSRPRIVIVRDGDSRNRALVEANGGRLIAGSGHFVAYTIAR